MTIPGSSAISNPQCYSPFDSLLLKDLIPNKNHNIWETTYDVLEKLDLPKELEYGKY